MSADLHNHDRLFPRRRSAAAPPLRWSDAPAASSAAAIGQRSKTPPGAPLFLAAEVTLHDEQAEQIGPPETAVAGRARGIVSRFDRQRGFGFITAEADGAQVFVHYTELLDPPGPDGWRQLLPGQRVAFTRLNGAGRDRAAGVRTL